MIASLATWILTYTLHSLALCTVAIAAIRLRRMDAALRCVALRSAIFLPFVTATIAVVGSQRVTVGSARSVSITEPLERYFPSWHGMQKVDVKVMKINGRPSERVVEVQDPVGTAVARIIVVLAILASAGGLALQRRGTRKVREALSTRTSSPVAVSLAAQHAIRISESRSIDVPVALRGREICIPTPAFSQMGFAERQSVMLHEIAHVDRNDPVWMDASRIVCRATRWQPLVRVVCEALERETELAADQRAIALGARPHALVAGLAHFAGLVNAGYAGAGAALLRGDSPLVTRARLLLEPPAASRKLSANLVWAAIILTAVASAMMPMPTAASAEPSMGAMGKGGVAQGVKVERTIMLKASQRQP